jgi:hypothetical protein
MTALLHFDEPGNPIRKLYKHAIDLAQGGKPDNERKQQRCYLLHQLLDQSVRKFPRFNVAEFGCWRGHSTLITAEVIKAADTNSVLHVFDSFEGLSKFRKEDLSQFQPTKAARDAERVHYASSIDRLRKLTDPYGFVRLHKGWIPDVFEGVDVGVLSFAMIDVDLYEPTLASAFWAYNRLTEGGVIFFDDYGYNCFPGAKKAVDEFLSLVRPTLFVENPMGSAYLVK